MLSMNRPADEGNDDMEVFILNVIFIDESYQLGRLVGSRFAKGWHVIFWGFFPRLLLVMQ